MSKGPFTARINQIDTAENFHILQVEQLTEQFFHGQKETLKVPVDERLSSLRSGDVITYYRAEEEYVITETPHSEERVVLLFKRSSDGLGLPEKALSVDSSGQASDAVAGFAAYCSNSAWFVFLLR